MTALLAWEAYRFEVSLTFNRIGFVIKVPAYELFSRYGITLLVLIHVVIPLRKELVIVPFLWTCSMS